MTGKRWGRLAVACVCAASLLATPVQAYETLQNPDFSYTYNVYGEAVPAPDFYQNTSAVGEGLVTPTDVFVHNGELYVLDAGGNRIAVYDAASGQPLRDILPTGEEEPTSLEDALGLFVQEDGTLYIALNKQQAVLVLDAQGQVLKRYGSPESSLIPRDFIYAPSKVAVQEDGMMYVVSDSSYQGLLQMKADGSFVGFFGSNTVTVTASAILNQMWRRLFNKEQQARLENTLPVDYSSVALGSDGFLYTTTDQEIEKEIKKLSPLGNNVLAYASQTAAGVVIGQDDYGDYETYRNANQTVDTAFIDLTVSEDGVIYALDSARGRVFAYDQNSHLLGIFGVTADQAGGFKLPVAITEEAGRVFVLDQGRQQVMVFEPTAYAEALLRAAVLFAQGNFAEAKPYWEEIRQQNANLPLCADGLGWAALEEQDYDTALAYFREARDVSGYNQAFLSQRNAFTDKWFIAIFAVCLLAVVALFVWISRAARKPAFNVRANGRRVLNPFQVMAHPFAGYEAMKDEHMGSVWWSLGLLAALFLSRMMTLCYTGFLFNDYRLEEIHLFAEFAQLMAIVLGFVICSWAVGTLMDSEGHFYEMFNATVYALCPYILTQIAAVLLSNIIVLREQAFLTALNAVGGYLTAAGLLIGIIKTHKFTFGKAILFILLVLVGILFLLFLFLMFYSLVGQLGTFLHSLYSELQYRL